MWPCTDDPDDFGTCSECVDGFGDDVVLDGKGDCPSCGVSFATDGIVPSKKATTPSNGCRCANCTCT